MRPSTKTILGVVGVVVPAVFSYLSARAESNEAKIRAEVAYVTLQAAVVDLKAEAKEHDEAVAALGARADALEDRLNARPLFSRPKEAHKADKAAPPAQFMEAVERFKSAAKK